MWVKETGAENDGRHESAFAELREMPSATARQSSLAGPCANVDGEGGAMGSDEACGVGTMMGVGTDAIPVCCRAWLCGHVLLVAISLVAADQNWGASCCLAGGKEGDSATRTSIPPTPTQRIKHCSNMRTFPSSPPPVAVCNRNAALPHPRTQPSFAINTLTPFFSHTVFCKGELAGRLPPSPHALITPSPLPPHP